LNAGALKRVHLRKVNVDTTVQEKTVTYPTDAEAFDSFRIPQKNGAIASEEK